MKTRILGILGGIVLLLSAGSVYAGGPDGPPPKAERISIPFYDWTQPNSPLPGTCDPLTYLPYLGEPACVYYEATAYLTTGDFVGNEFEEDSLVAYPNGAVAYAGYGVFTGTLKGRDTGTFVILDTGSSTASGFITGTLRIVNGTGSGDLVGISGSGSYAGSYLTPVATMTVEFPPK
jgi:hypothetical protein